MSDNYQAVYDAVRSKIGFIDLQQVVNSFDVSFYIDQVKNSFQEVAWEMARPSVVWKPTLTIDGNMWCALYGDNLQDGVAGFGKSPADAMIDFDKNWKLKIDS